MSEQLSRKLQDEAEKLPEEQRVAFIKGAQAARTEAQQEREEREQRELQRRRYASQF